MGLIRAFNDADPRNSGGKGKHLIELVRSFFPVPVGFIVTFDAYSLYTQNGSMPDVLTKDVVKFYTDLTETTGNDKVAVRSSASAEDIDTASFAGQYDSYLYVKGEDEVIKKIVECWDSLFTERAVVYRKRMNIPDRDIKMAVVVQTMIEPIAAGVMFTAKPYSGDNNVVIVESNWGCGETVVSGRVTPDHFEIQKDTCHVTTRNIGEKQVILRGNESGALEETTTEEQRNSYSLTDETLRKLCEIGLKIETLFGRPQDIEWALGGEQEIFILQSRAIKNYV